MWDSRRKKRQQRKTGRSSADWQSRTGADSDCVAQERSSQASVDRLSTAKELDEKVDREREKGLEKDRHNELANPETSYSKVFARFAEASDW